MADEERASKWIPAPNFTAQEFGHEKFEALSIESRLIHSRLEPLDPGVDPLTLPIYHSSVYRNSSVSQYADIVNSPLGSKNYIYQRLGHPSALTAELMINEMEEGAGTLMCTSGLSASTTVLMCFLKSGDHLLIQRPVYSGVQRFAGETLTKFGVDVEWVLVGSSPEDYQNKIKPNTKMIYVETPCNPLMTITDIQGVGGLSGLGNDLLVCVDSTFASPLLQKPIKLGCDIVVHSCTKYMGQFNFLFMINNNFGGHTDLVAGCASFKSLLNWKIMKKYQQSTGSYLAAFDSTLLIRGMKTLPLRMERHCSSAMIIATCLAAHPKVVAVHYPGLTSHPGYEIAKRQMTSFGGMISFEMADLDSAQRLVEGLKLIILAVSLGGTESLIEHPATMTHGSMIMSAEDRKLSLISDGLVRLSVGIEEPKDLVLDLEQALEKV